MNKIMEVLTAELRERLPSSLAVILGTDHILIQPFEGYRFIRFNGDIVVDCYAHTKGGWVFELADPNSVDGIIKLVKSVLIEFSPLSQVMMKRQFCKLFGPDDDQILVKTGDNEAGDPELRIYFTTPFEALSVCEVVLVMKSEKHRKEAFAKIDEKMARHYVDQEIERLRSAFE